MKLVRIPDRKYSRCVHSRSLKGLIVAVGVLTAFAVSTQPAVAGDPEDNWPAYIEHIPTRLPQLFVFPPAGPAVEVALPSSISKDFRLIEYSPDGEAIYGQKLNSWDGIVKIEFSPARESVVPGSAGFGAISSIVVDPSSGMILASGSFKRSEIFECGVYEINPRLANVRRLLKGTFPNCGGAIAPDGKHIAHFPGNHLSIIDLDTGAVHPIGDEFSGAT